MVTSMEQVYHAPAARTRWEATLNNARSIGVAGGTTGRVCRDR
jgi:hypothetical protein